MTACGAKIPTGECPGKRSFFARFKMVTARLAQFLPFLAQQETHGIFQLPLGFLETLRSRLDVNVFNRLGLSGNCHTV